MQEFIPNYYDLILLDIKMPVLNGFELCKKIRELDKNLQIIFITASELFYESIRENRYPELVNNNVNYIQKPIANEELIKVVNTMMSASDSTRIRGESTFAQT
jgi:two-component SAPR family response regulator